MTDDRMEKISLRVHISYLICRKFPPRITIKSDKLQPKEFSAKYTQIGTKGKKF
jgi:hypothetical protein